jgi:hypothetical protein
MQQRLKSTAGFARAQIIATKFFDQLLSSAYYAITALHMGFRREAFSALAADLESN